MYSDYCFVVWVSERGGVCIEQLSNPFPPIVIRNTHPQDLIRAQKHGSRGGTLRPEVQQPCSFLWAVNASWACCAWVLACFTSACLRRYARGDKVLNCAAI